MSETPVRGVVVGHGALAEGLVDAVLQITGEEDALFAVSNRGLSAEALAGRIRELVGEGPAILFTDLQSGSCAFVAHRLCRDVPGLLLISGANLPILLDFVTHRELPVEELVPRLLDRGRAAIGCAPGDWGVHAGRPVPRR